MHDRPTSLERAYALAGSGECRSLKTIREQLKAEGYAEAGQLSSASVRKQLAALIAKAKG